MHDFIRKLPTSSNRYYCDESIENFQKLATLLQENGGDNEFTQMFELLELIAKLHPDHKDTSLKILAHTKDVFLSSSWSIEPTEMNDKTKGKPSKRF